GGETPGGGTAAIRRGSDRSLSRLCRQETNGMSVPEKVLRSWFSWPLIRFFVLLGAIERRETDRILLKIFVETLSLDFRQTFLLGSLQSECPRLPCGGSHGG